MKRKLEKWNARSGSDFIYDCQILFLNQLSLLMNETGVGQGIGPNLLYFTL